MNPFTRGHDLLPSLIVVIVIARLYGHRSRLESDSTLEPTSLFFLLLPLTLFPSFPPFSSYPFRAPKQHLHQDLTQLTFASITEQKSRLVAARPSPGQLLSSIASAIAIPTNFTSPHLGLRKDAFSATMDPAGAAAPSPTSATKVVVNKLIPKRLRRKPAPSTPNIQWHSTFSSGNLTAPADQGAAGMDGEGDEAYDSDPQT